MLSYISDNPEDQLVNDDWKLTMANCQTIESLKQSSTEGEKKKGKEKSDQDIALDEGEEDMSQKQR